MSLVRETCGCGATWEGGSTYREERERFREAHAACRQSGDGVLLQRERDEIRDERDAHWSKLAQAHAGLEDMAESVYPPAAQDARNLLAALDGSNQEETEADGGEA